MEKKRKWQLFLILSVIALTIYNILPTVFYYCKPLKSPVSEQQIQEIAASIGNRVNRLESETKDWISSFCELLQIKPLSISEDSENPQLLSVHFTSADHASRFRRFLPRAGSIIPFAPAQLNLVSAEENPKEVRIQRRIPIRFEDGQEIFSSVTKINSDQKISPSYRQLILDRASQIAFALCGPSESASLLTSLEANASRESLDSLASQIHTVMELFEEKGPLAKRYASRYTQGILSNRTNAVRALSSAFDRLRDELKKEKTSLAELGKKREGEGLFLSDEEQLRLRLLDKKERSLSSAGKFLKKQEALFSSGNEAWSLAQIKSLLNAQEGSNDLQILEFGSRNPLFSEIVIDWASEQILLKLHPDVAANRLDYKNKELFQQLLINEIAKVTRLTNEMASSDEEGYSIAFHHLPNAQSFLVMDLEKIARLQVSQTTAMLKANWHPTHPDLKDLAIVDFETYEKLSPEQKVLCLVVHAPLCPETSQSSRGLNNLQNSSIYVTAKGIDQILKSYEQFPNTDLAKLFFADFRSLAELLRQNGFLGYPASAFYSQPGSAKDFVFEKSDFFQMLISATREPFVVNGTKKYAVLEFSDLEQRLVASNQIETRIHEDLLKWKDEYQAAQVSLNPALKYDVPKPTRSLFWSNIGLSLRKFFRGDEKKVLRWGLDLSGGKTVQIELRDGNNQIVKNEADIKQGINELYHRVNKMGVSEVAIRQVGNSIVLDFPGSQALSASELIKASSMYFHVVNEKFSLNNPILAEDVHRFLQEIWNEAVVTRKTDAESINAIAWKHLYGESGTQETRQPRSETARILLENGLKLQSPLDLSSNNELNDSVSKIAVLRGTDFHDWHGQTHPLIFIFKNFALEGSQLENVRSNYDPSKGNYLSFEVRGASLNREGQKINPRNSLFSWTSRFCKEKILGTPNEAYSHGHGWRMAVVLNDTVINSPTLDAALRDSAMISGNFSQREVSQLVSDLKAGSLTFTPHILSEKNVSPELGIQDRIHGITATFVALALVIAAMVVYYRFAGVVASVAVLFNLLILWATLQNIGATLSLAGIAGIILTVGMAVDANVLVFERMKEEFAISGRISSAISAGYKKAYSAIIDSNVTTIIAALILLNFDAGPIKGFALTLIIGIVSSMFTALFMTRFYFTGWAQNPKNKVLNIGKSWIAAKGIDFLKQSKIAFSIAALLILGGGYLLYAERATIFGMDFTGGFSLHVEIEKETNVNYSLAAREALIANGAVERDFQIRELNPSNQLRILLGTSMEQPGKPFANLAIETEGDHFAYSYQKNPRIDWVVKSLASQGLNLTQASKDHLEANWTSMSGQMSDTMRNNALIGLLISFISIFIYISFRFEYKFAAAALLCLIHDILITVGLMGLLHAFGVPLQIDLNTVAAIMTIVGYSLNDTIIIFDRIREEMRLSRNRKLSQIINEALNVTLGRTSITSGITLLVLLTLIVLGGSSLFSFALVMAIGVFFGTLSSWYIASPLMLFFHRREEVNENKLARLS